MFKIFRKKEVKVIPKGPPLTKSQEAAKAVAISAHKTRTNNLNLELEQISEKLKLLESNFDIGRNDKEKASNAYIKRMTLIQYEINIREELVEWLS